MSSKPDGPIVLWVNYGYEGWQPKSFASIREALEEDKGYCEWVITRLVMYEVIEKPE